MLGTGINLNGWHLPIAGRVALLIAAGVIIISCGGQSAEKAPDSTSTVKPTATLPSTPTMQPTPTPEPTDTPAQTATPVMYKLASNTYAPEGVWKSLLHRYPEVFLLVAAKVTNAETDIHAVLTVSAWCDTRVRQLGLVGVEVSRGAELIGSRHWETTVQLSGDNAYKTTWIDLSIRKDSPANLWRLWGTVLGEEWPAGYPSPQDEVPFWDSLLPGLYAGKDFHFTIDEKLTATFDAEGFRSEWDAINPTCPLYPTLAPAPIPLATSEALTTDQYFTWCSANTSNDTMARVLSIDPNDFADVSTVTYGDMVRVLEAHLQIVKVIMPPPALARYHIAQIGFFEGLIQYYEGFPPKIYIDWRLFERDLLEDADLSWKFLTLTTAVDRLPGNLSQQVVTHCSN